MQEEIKTALSTRLQDQKVVEVEITEKVLNRVQGIGKIVGIPIALLAVVLSWWGIHNLSDVSNRIDKATEKAVTNMNEKVETATKKSLDEMNVKVTKESNDAVAEAKESARLNLQSAVTAATKDLQTQAKSAQSDIVRIQKEADLAFSDINKIGQRLGSVETTVEGLAKAVTCGTGDALAPARNIEECHANYPNGCSGSASARYDAYLNSLKNKTPLATSKPSRFLSLTDFIALDHATPNTTTRENHEDHKSELAQIGEANIVGVIGYLYSARLAGAETVNCQLIGEQNVDFMLSIGFDDKLAVELNQKHSLSKAGERKLEKISIVAEVTPYYRLKFQPKWTMAMLSAIVGRQVKVVGQLMLDSMHFNPMDDCSGPGSPQAMCWRASAWEIHPVMELWVCSSEGACSIEDAHWVKLAEHI